MTLLKKNQEYALMEQLSSDPIPSDEIDQKDQESDDEEYYNATNEESDDEEEIICNDEKITSERVMLSNDKLPKDQLKFIVFEESIANVFRVCFNFQTFNKRTLFPQFSMFGKENNLNYWKILKISLL